MIFMLKRHLDVLEFWRFGCPLYPLQRDGNICGIVATCMLAMAALARSHFDDIMKRDSKSWYLSNPTRYNRYLRSVIMAWFSKEKISINYIIPQDALNNEVESSEDEYVVRVPFEVSNEENIDFKKLASNNVETDGNAICKNEEMQTDGKKFKSTLCNMTMNRRNNLKHLIERFHEQGKWQHLLKVENVCVFNVAITVYK